MKFILVLEVLFVSAVVDGGVSMHNPNFCYMTDPVRPFTTMMTDFTSYEAIRRFNVTTFDPYISSTS